MKSSSFSRRMVKSLYAVLALVFVFVSLAGCSNAGNQPSDSTAAGEDRPEVVLEIRTQTPEYLAQEEEIWSIYTDENPNVTVDIFAVGDSEAAFEARVAAGDPPDIQNRVFGMTKSTYKTYVNIQETDFPYWDLLTYDAKNDFSKLLGLSESYTPCINDMAGVTFCFCYYEDEMDKAGLKPRETVRSLEDLDKFLADLKAYVDKDPKLEYVLDYGWTWDGTGRNLTQSFAIAAGFTPDDMLNVFLGKTPWTDLEKNPFAVGLKIFKDFYDKGYFPKQFWTRQWETDYEAGFIAKKSILCFHGPWIWNKVMAANPSAKLAGFPFPIGKSGLVFSGVMNPGYGAVMFTDNKDETEKFKETVKAYNWWLSPEIVKMRCEALGLVTSYDLSKYGGLNLKSAQYNTVIKPFAEGFFGKGKWAARFPENDVVKYMKQGKPDVMSDLALASEYGKYFEGKTSLLDLMKLFEKRNLDTYDLP